MESARVKAASEMLMKFNTGQHCHLKFFLHFLNSDLVQLEIKSNIWVMNRLKMTFLSSFYYITLQNQKVLRNTE